MEALRSRYGFAQLIGTAFVLILYVGIWSACIRWIVPGWADDALDIGFLAVGLLVFGVSPVQAARLIWGATIAATGFGFFLTLVIIGLGRVAWGAFFGLIS